MVNKKSDSLDACPFTPDSDPPRKTLTTNMLELTDSFFDGWRNVGVAVTLISILTIYSLFSAALPLIPEFVTPESWNKQVEFQYSDSYTYLLSDFDFDEPEIISENIVLRGEDSLVFEKKTILLEGYILLEDESKLILHNSTLIIGNRPRPSQNPLFDDHANLLFTDTSSLVMKNSKIIPTRYAYLIGFVDQSVLSTTNTICENGSIWFDDSASFTLDTSYLSMMFFDQSVSGNIMNSQLFSIDNVNDWRPQRIVSNEGSDGAIQIINSDIDVISFTILGGSFNLDSQTGGYHDNWNNKKNMSITGKTPDITVIESRTGFVNIICTNTQGIVRNLSDNAALFLNHSVCQIHDSTIFHVDSLRSNILVNNSYLKHLWVTPTIDPEFESKTEIEAKLTNTTLINSRIEKITSSGAFIQNENVFIDHIRIDALGNIITEIGDGGITYGKNAELNLYNTYDKMTVNHHYRVITAGEEHVIPSVPLSLVNGSGVTVWSGQTDGRGYASFNITYCNLYPLYRPYQYVTNTNDTWKLYATIGDSTVEKEIKFLETGSPIILQLPEPGLLSRAQISPLSLAGVASIVIVLSLKLLRRG